MLRKKDWRDWLGFDSARKGDSSGQPDEGPPHNAPDRLRLAGVVAVVLVLGILAWLLFLDGGDDDPTPAGTSASTASNQVSVVDGSDLLDTLEGVGYPIYWAGPRSGVGYEVSRTSPDRTYIRYLPDGEEAGSELPFLTVASYRQENALAEIRDLAKKPNAIVVGVAAGGSAYAEGPDATSAYLAFPGVNTQIEVFDPQPGKALDLIRSGAIVPVA